MSRKSPVERLQLRPLGTREIERRLRGVAVEVAEPDRVRGAGAWALGRPRWISTAELARRMSRFIVLN